MSDPYMCDPMNLTKVLMHCSAPQQIPLEAPAVPWDQPDNALADEQRRVDPSTVNALIGVISRFDGDPKPSCHDVVELFRKGSGLVKFVHRDNARVDYRNAHYMFVDPIPTGAAFGLRAPVNGRELQAAIRSVAEGRSRFNPKQP